MEKKKRWVQPELTVLVRSKPEEGVLMVCKTMEEALGPEDMYSGCDMFDIEACMPCFDFAES
jgi:hypothetical protein